MEFNPNFKYVIGGLVDGKIKKNSSKNIAQELKVEMRKLPLKEAGVNLGEVRTSLNIDKMI